MERIRKTLILLALFAILPAAHSTITPPESLCFASGASTYRLEPAAAQPDVRVRIDNAAQNPDLRIQMVDRPELADFVLADDYGATANPANPSCRSPMPAKTVTIDGKTPHPHVTVQLSPDATDPDFRVYVHSVRYSHQDAAALLAATWTAARSRDLADLR